MRSAAWPPDEVLALLHEEDWPNVPMVDDSHGEPRCKKSRNDDGQWKNADTGTDAVANADQNMNADADNHQNTDADSNPNTDGHTGAHSNPDTDTDAISGRHGPSGDRCEDMLPSGDPWCIV